ncbi:MAG TPA: HlyD family secretion protein [Pseudonocardiaceae bacterium]|nr:HlyD family secretion protein [Pseudonocardiaceae bacterium]
MTRNRIIGGVAVVVVVAALIIGIAVVTAHARKPAPPPAAAQVSTATVTRTNLSNSQTLAGTLGFGAASTVTGKGTGTITSLPQAGATISRGQALYGVDAQPVIVFYGGTPLYRTLSVATPPMQGPDVSVVASNLKALGYHVASSDLYTQALADEVTKWQKKIGMAQTGTLGVGQIVVFPGAVRINGIQAQLGDSATEPVLAVTPTDKVITVPVAATNLTGINTGNKVSITLPNGQPVPGTVGAISQTIQSNNQDNYPGAPPTPPNVNVTITADNPADVANLAAAPVQVAFTTSGKNNVLAVPVTALLALRGGGYALQLPNGKLVPVRTGLFANGEVEVSGPGVTEGLHVQTAQS